MKSTIRIPKTEIDITCRNKREEGLARIFVRQFHQVVRWALESDDVEYWARKVTSEFGYFENYIKELDGQASSMYWLGMLKEPLGMMEIHEAIVAMYEEGKAAQAASPADEDDDSEMYMDEIKADASYCLGIEYGSDEWYALAEI